MPKPRNQPPPLRDLSDPERRHYRDELRAARYAALADAEGFDRICFALEALGLRLLGIQGDMGQYGERIGVHARRSPVLNDFATTHTATFKPFKALYEIVRKARNDNMHLGAYARHATSAAIELCIGLEEALMADVARRVGHVMVRSPIVVEPWQPVAQAQQLMLMHSFSFLPVWHGEAWHLLSELALARFLNVGREEKFKRLGRAEEAAAGDAGGLQLLRVPRERLLNVRTPVDEALGEDAAAGGPTLWLVVEDERPERLAGVLSPFELM